MLRPLDCWPTALRPPALDINCDHRMTNYSPLVTTTTSTAVQHKHARVFLVLRVLVVLCLSFFATTLSACTSTQFLLSQWKEYEGPPSGSKGLFKVGKPYRVDGQTYRPTESYALDETGIASWYGPGFHSKTTANGERFSENELTAAHRTLQLPSLVRVTNLENGKSVVLRVNDRGPFARSRIIDVSKRAADLLEFRGKGTARVRVQVLAEESRMMAEAARAGRDTRGMEIALNQQQPGDAPPNLYQTASISSPVYNSDPAISAVTSERLPDNNPGGYARPTIPGHIAPTGQFYPDPVVEQFPVIPTAIYIQAGSYGNHDNAIRVSQTLSALGAVRIAPVLISGQQYFRVQLGPLQSVDQADGMLSQVINLGYPEARITIDNSS